MNSALLRALKQAVDLERENGDVRAAANILTSALDSNTEPTAMGLSTATGHLAILCERLGELDTAVVYLRRCRERLPENLGTLYSLARLLGVSGNLPEAREVAAAFRQACVTSSHPLRDGWAELLEPLDRELSS